jgi:Raf kinase inhibitor-like YbhB/YbcL family protein
METPVNGETEQQGELELTSPAFDDGELMPDSVGPANENESPPLHIDGVPDGTESLVLIMDDPEAKGVAGHVWDHWIVYNIDPEIDEIPRGQAPDGATVAYNDFVEQGWGGPSPPEGAHDYYFKLFALDGTIDYPAGIRKARIGSVIAMETEILAQTQLIGRYDAEQGTIF